MEGTKKLVRVIKTRVTEDDPQVETTLTMDFTGLSDQDIMEIAAQATVVKVQGILRKIKTGIPSIYEYKVPRPGTRSVQPVDHAAALVKILGAEQAYVVIKRFGSAEKAAEALKSLLGPVEEPKEEGEQTEVDVEVDETKE